MTWRWDDKREGMITSSGRTKACTVFSVEALPLCVGDDGARESVGVYVAGAQVFAAEQAAFDYIKMLARRDLQYRGFRDDRVRCFGCKQDANFLLHQRVRSFQDAEELQMLRWHWDVINRPEYKSFDWSTKQQEVLRKIRIATSFDDEEAKKASQRWLYVSGAPGSCKSALILEGAVAAEKEGLHVLIMCPTGQLVHSFKAHLPDVDGVEYISVDTIQGVLNYQRPGKDRQVRWAPPPGCAATT